MSGMSNCSTKGLVITKIIVWQNAEKKKRLPNQEFSPTGHGSLWGASRYTALLIRVSWPVSKTLPKVGEFRIFSKSMNCSILELCRSILYAQSILDERIFT